MATASKKWKVFLSHSSKDESFADWLYEKLVSVNVAVWYDKYELLIGDSLIGKIDEGLRGSEFLIVVISKESVKSNWVKAELEPKILRQIKKKKITVLPVVLDGIDPGKISVFLEGKKSIRFPLAGSDQEFEQLLKSITGHTS